METLEPTPPPQRRSRTLLGIGIGLVIAALIGLGVLLIPRLLGTTAGAVNVTAAAMPANTQVYFSFNPHFDQLPNGDVVRKAWGDTEMARLVEDGIRDALADNDLDWNQDIVPWLGDEIGIGLWNLPLDFTTSDAPPPSVALVFATRGAAMSEAALAELRAGVESSGGQFAEQTYRDVKTVEQTDPGSGQPIAYALIEDLAIVATGSSDLHAAIDALLDKDGLDTSSNYQATIDQLRGGRALTVYADLGALFKAFVEQMQETGELPPATVDQSTLAAVEALQGTAMGLSFEPNGLRLEIVATTDVNQLPAEQQALLSVPANPSRLLRAVPDSTFLFVGGEIQPAMLDMLMENPGFADSLAVIEDQIGIDLANDVFSWMTGELAIVAMPGSFAGGGPSPFPFSFAALLWATDKQRAEAGTHELIQKLVAQSEGEIGEVEVGDARLHAVLDPASGEPTLVYGLIGDNLVLAFPQAAAERIADAAGRPLADDDTFKATIAPLPSSNSGYFYLKPRPVVDLVTLGLSVSGQGCVPCALFEPVRAMAFAAEQPQAEAGVGRTTLFVLLETSAGE